MEYSPVFLKIRAITFSLISLLSFIWIIVLCVDLFIQWNALGISEKSFLSVMLLANTMTLSILLVLLLISFRPWLDAARLMLLLLIHIGIASGFVVSNSKFTCPTKTADEEGVCRLLNMYILIANWVIPTLLVGYACGLAFMVYRRKKAMQASPDLESPKVLDSRQSILPMMKPENVRHPSMSTLHTSVISQQRRGSAPTIKFSSTPPQSMVIDGRRGSASTNSVSTPPQSMVVDGKRASSGRARLSKPLPGWMYY